MLLLLSDGMSTDDWETPLNELQEVPGYALATRLCLPKTDHDDCNTRMLQAFAGDRVVYGKDGLGALRAVGELLNHAV